MPSWIERPGPWGAAALCALLGGCQDLTDRATRTATESGLAAAVVPGTTYRHALFVNHPAAGQALFVFIEGDGSPWSRDGREPARDPTPHRPLALDLAARTDGSVMYLGRPCYFSARSDPACNPAVWTSQRYSAAVVASAAAVVNRYAAANSIGRIVLIGYSGGGTLAVLLAARIPATQAVVTIAADLDIEAWTTWHGYLPLAGSLNPAEQAPLGSGIEQWHLIGGRDDNAPESVSARYLDRLDPEQVWRFASFDHVCCWIEAWPDILRRIRSALDGP